MGDKVACGLPLNDDGETLSKRQPLTFDNAQVRRSLQSVAVNSLGSWLLVYSSQ